MNHMKENELFMHVLDCIENNSIDAKAVEGIKLFSIAPELLEMVEEMTAKLEWWEKNKSASELAEKARLLIARVRGESK